MARWICTIRYSKRSNFYRSKQKFRFFSPVCWIKYNVKKINPTYFYHLTKNSRETFRHRQELLKKIQIKYKSNKVLEANQMGLSLETAAIYDRMIEFLVSQQ